MNWQRVTGHITEWMRGYALQAGSGGFVLGISGGIDSAVTSVLCAETGLRTLTLNLPIRQGVDQFTRGNEQIEWLQKKYRNVEREIVDLTATFDELEKSLPAGARTPLSMANARARLRMTTLYAFAGAQNLLVAGTGNKIEDFGIGFFTKYGDGGVDLSPIADLTKTEIYALASHMGLPDSIQKAVPTDGLYADSPSDEAQIGASYPELEWAMNYVQEKNTSPLTERQKAVLEIYKKRNAANRHKVEPIPVCRIPEELKN